MFICVIHVHKIIIFVIYCLLIIYKNLVNKNDSMVPGSINCNLQNKCFITVAKQHLVQEKCLKRSEVTIMQYPAMVVYTPNTTQIVCTIVFLIKSKVATTPGNLIYFLLNTPPAIQFQQSHSQQWQFCTVLKQYISFFN